MKLHWQKYTLNFKHAAGTSRGVLHVKDSYFIRLTDGDRTGWGECGILRGLSADDRPDYEACLNWLKDNIGLPVAELYGELEEFPSIQFGLEMALRDLEVEDHLFFPSDFTAGHAGQPINGLIWMGDPEFMKDQIRRRLDEGFDTLKMKIGAVDPAQELNLLRRIRREFTPEEISLRVDANGAFSPQEVLPFLEELAGLSVHSIEQPIAKGQWQEMARICESSPIPIALDEELIGCFSMAERERLINTIKPQFIILKPSFIGGWRGSEEWVALADAKNIGWWVTSALESNYGLNAIAQWNYLQKNEIASGLGTGSLYTNNLESPLEVKGGKLYYNPAAKWHLDALD